MIKGGRKHLKNNLRLTSDILRERSSAIRNQLLSTYYTLRITGKKWWCLHYDEHSEVHTNFFLNFHSARCHIATGTQQQSLYINNAHHQSMQLLVTHLAVANLQKIPRKVSYILTSSWKCKNAALSQLSCIRNVPRIPCSDLAEDEIVF